MAYSLEIADAVSRTVGKFGTLNDYQLAGHLANLEFWTSQIKNALNAIDGYSKRQRALEQAQKEHISAHDTRRFFPEELELHREFPREPEYEPGLAKPDRRQINSETLKAKRRDVADSFYRFLLRCHKEKLLRNEDARRALSECGIGIEPGDFRDD